MLAEVYSVRHAWKERSAPTMQLHIKLQQDNNAHILFYPCPITVVSCRPDYRWFKSTHALTEK